jgi:DNA primase
LIGYILNLLLLELLEICLGKSSLKKNGQEAVFYCCFCHHYKPKLSVNLNTGAWHCWVCPNAGKKVTSLLKKINRSDKIAEARKITHDTYHAKSERIATDLMLPSEFQSLIKKSNQPEYKHALRYVIERNITTYDIMKYNLGYCASGKYKNRIIIPSYDASGSLNFFIGRSYYRSTYLEYLSPDWSKNIIGFDVFINWNEPVILVEGPMDAIAIRRNAIPLFGKIISPALKMKIIQQKVKDLYIILDQDAIMKALDYCEEFLGYNMNVYLVEMVDKDSSKLGFVETWKQIEATQAMDYKMLFTYRMKYGQTKTRY